MSFCAFPICGEDICENCQIQAPNQQFYCTRCFIDRPELQQTLVTVDEGNGDEDDDDDMFAFDKGDSESKQSFVKIGIQRDKGTG